MVCFWHKCLITSCEAKVCGSKSRVLVLEILLKGLLFFTGGGISARFSALKLCTCKCLLEKQNFFVSADAFKNCVKISVEQRHS